METARSSRSPHPTPPDPPLPRPLAEREDAAVLLVTSAPGGHRALGTSFGRAFVSTVVAADAHAALDLAASRPFVLAIVDLADGLSAVTTLHLLRAHATMPIVALADAADPSRSVEALDAGALDVLAWPIEDRDAALLLANLADRRGVDSGLDVEDDPDPVFAHSAPMRAAMHQVRLAAGERSHVLFVGEPATGRRLLGRVLHRTGGRGDRPMVSLDCAGLAPRDIERRLFGTTEDSALPVSDDAVEPIDAESALGRARGGTLALSHLSDAPARVQVRLARVLRDREARLAGSRLVVPLDVRLATAAAADGAGGPADGRLRSDLVERLAEVRIDVPPLRRRREDVPLLAAYLLRRASARHGVDPKRFSQAAMAVLAALPWHGNAADLTTLVDVMIEQVPGAVVQIGDVLAHATLDGLAAPVEAGLTLRDARARFERDCISAVLVRHRGRVGEAAKALGIQRTNLYRKVRQLKVQRSLLTTRK
jgi:two-component system response regulator HydG